MKLKTAFNTWDIRFWIILFFILRIHGLFNPPLEVAHNWRQTTVTMVARNFLETDTNILYPRIDIAGEKTGITGMEFPVLNYLIYLLSLVFGYAHWYGRLINLVVSSIGLHYFYKLLRKYSDEKTAFYSTLVLLFSIWLNYSRKIMPDTFSVSLLLIGFYYGSEILDGKATWKNTLAYLTFTLTGILSKLPVAYLFALAPFLLFDKNIRPDSKLKWLLLTALILAIPACYYFMWVPHLNTTFGFVHFFMGKSLNDGFTDIITHTDEALAKFYEEALGFSGFLLFLYGIVFAFKQRQRHLLCIFGLAFCAFLIIVLKAGFAFYHHSYYIIPFVPLMAIVVGNMLAKLPKQSLAIILLCILAIESILTKNADFYVKESHLAIMHLEKDLDRLCSREELILINSGKVPTPMYFSHRKGWIASNEEILRTGYLDSLQQKGLEYVVVLKRAFGEELSLPKKKVFENTDYSIYRQ